MQRLVSRRAAWRARGDCRGASETRGVARRPSCARHCRRVAVFVRSGSLSQVCRPLLTLVAEWSGVVPVSTLARFAGRRAAGRRRLRTRSSASSPGRRDRSSTLAPNEPDVPLDDARGEDRAGGRRSPQSTRCSSACWLVGAGRRAFPPGPLPKAVTFFVVLVAMFAIGLAFGGRLFPFQLGGPARVPGCGRRVGDRGAAGPRRTRRARRRQRRRPSPTSTATPS